mgnify:CR=1 FL=1
MLTYLENVEFLNDRGDMVITTSFSCSLMVKYQETALLDATYNVNNTSRNILYIAAICTNEGYQPGALMLTQNEDTITIASFLKYLKEVKQFKPSYWMSDDSAAQLAAIKEVYPGNIK